MRQLAVAMLVLGAGCLSSPKDPGAKPADAAVTMGPDAPPVTLQLFGDTTTYDCVDPHDPGVAEASSFIAAHDGIVTSLGLEYGGGRLNGAADVPHTIVLALYDDINGMHPHTLLDQVTIGGTGPLAAGTLSGTAHGGQQVLAGHTYWIAAYCPANELGQCGFRYSYQPGNNANCGNDTSTPCNSRVASCTEHSDSALSLIAPPDTWVPGATFGLSVNSYFAGGG